MPSLLLHAGETGQVEQVVELQEDLCAPVHTGDRVGRIRFLVGGREAASVEITAAAEVEAVTFGSALAYLVRNLLSW